MWHWTTHPVNWSQIVNNYVLKYWRHNYNVDNNPSCNGETLLRGVHTLLLLFWTAHIGGLLALFLGASLITCLQLIDVIVHHACALLTTDRRRRRRKSRDTGDDVKCRQNGTARPLVDDDVTCGRRRETLVVRATTSDGRLPTETDI